MIKILYTIEILYLMQLFSLLLLGRGSIHPTQTERHTSMILWTMIELDSTQWVNIIQD